MMNVSGMNPAAVGYQQAGVQGVSFKAQEVAAEEAAIVEAEVAEDVFEPSPEVVDKSKFDYSEKVSALLAESKQQIAKFQDLFARYLGGQAENYSIANWSKSFLEEAFQKATPEDVAAAKEAISDGGYYSVDAVATRIMDMAMALSGGDESKIELLRGAVEEGFKQAGQIFGDELPGICQDTYNEIMNRFDEWAGINQEEEAVAEAETEAAAE